jgi:3',5'-cyclic AMP phosphodiesterase CpdA
MPRLLALVLAGVLCAAPAGADAPALRASLLSVGDTGAPDGSQDLAVAEEIDVEDRRAPADALVLLGDNFYPHGLRHKELVQRIARNVVRPWCRFVVLTAPRSDEVRDACKLGDDERRPTPIYAVLGNHDYQSPESPELQREAIPQFVANWRMPFRHAEKIEFEGGLSLVLFDSVELAVHDRGGAELARVLSRTRGPWRVIAAHHPPIRAELTREERLYRERLARALEDSGVPVHLMLAGHEHSLQIIEMDAPWPPLLVVAGSGSDRKDIETREPGLRFARKEHGFARVDLVAEAGAERLEVTLFTTPEHPLYPGGPEPVSTWHVDPDGRARPATPPDR